MFEVDEECGVSEEVVRYFRDRFSKETRERDQLIFPTFSIEKSALLSHPFFMDENDRVVSDCNGNKSPRPDGFNFEFIKEFRDILPQ